MIKTQFKGWQNALTRGGVRGVLPPLLLYRHLASANQKAHEASPDDLSIDG